MERLPQQKEKQPLIHRRCVSNLWLTMKRTSLGCLATGGKRNARQIPKTCPLHNIFFLEAGCGLTNHTFGLTARFPFLGGEFPKVMKVIGAPGLLEVGFLSFFLASLGPQAPGKRGTQPSSNHKSSFFLLFLNLFYGEGSP